MDNTFFKSYCLAWFIFLSAIPKMFSDSYYLLEMSKYPFDYHVIGQEESLKGLEANKKMK